jgi:hypothetical protein
MAPLGPNFDRGVMQRGRTKDVEPRVRYAFDDERPRSEKVVKALRLGGCANEREVFSFRCLLREWEIAA